MKFLLDMIVVYIKTDCFSECVILDLCLDDILIFWEFSWHTVRHWFVICLKILLSRLCRDQKPIQLENINWQLFYPLNIHFPKKIYYIIWKKSPVFYINIKWIYVLSFKCNITVTLTNSLNIIYATRTCLNTEPVAV